MSQRISDEKPDLQFCAKADNPKGILQILKAVYFEGVATVFGSANGLKVTVEVAKSIQANAFIQHDIFHEFKIKEDIFTFKISLKALIECLNIFGLPSSPGVTPSLKMSYSGYGTPLEIEMEEGGIITHCKIRTLEADDTLDFKFINTDVVNKVIMKSEVLKEIFSELDASSNVLEIVMSPNPPHFRLSTFGTFGTNHIDMPKTSEMIETFSVKENSSQQYKLQLLKHCTKALTASQKVSVRTDNRGFLCFQFMIKTEDNHICFVEFFCCPEEEESD